MTSFNPHKEDALLIIDVQNDFLTGGSLAVPGENEDTFIANINELSSRSFGAVIASQDWHPHHHCSFTPQGGRWPIHCVADTQGSALHKDLCTRTISHIIHKGMKPQKECYSAFMDETGTSTGLTGLLTGLGIKRVVICGVALDYCVKESTLDSIEAGFETFLATELCRSINDPAPILDILSSKGGQLL